MQRDVGVFVIQQYHVVEGWCTCYHIAMNGLVFFKTLKKAIKHLELYQQYRQEVDKRRKERIKRQQENSAVYYPPTYERVTY